MKPLKDRSYLTAIVRKRPSLPMRFLDKKGLIRGRVLDYGCGRGFDVKHFDIEGFDPHFRPHLPRGKFDTITCNYVLNVVGLWKGREIIEHVKSMLRPGGKAYFTVRRDRFKPGRTSKGTFQRWVELPYPLVRSTSTYAIYELSV